VPDWIRSDGGDGSVTDETWDLEYGGVSLHVARYLDREYGWNWQTGIDGDRVSVSASGLAATKEAAQAGAHAAVAPLKGALALITHEERR